MQHLKPVHHVSLRDWESAFSRLQETVESSRMESWRMRQEYTQLRNEVGHEGRWDQFYIRAALQDRRDELHRWHVVLAKCLESVEKEIAALTAAKQQAEGEASTIEKLLTNLAQSLLLMDTRHGWDLNQDGAYLAFKTEERVLKKMRDNLMDKCTAAFEQLAKIKGTQLDLMLDLENKVTAMNIDDDNIRKTRDSEDISYKPDPLRVPPNCVPYETWVEKSRMNKLKADQEITISKKLREALKVLAAKLKNDLRTQLDATNEAVQRRIFDLTKAWDRLMWQRQQLEKEINKLMKEIENLEEEFLQKTNSLKLAETRLENRILRPGAELVHDEPQIELGKEVLALRKVREELAERIAKAKSTYTALMTILQRLSEDIDNKKHSLDMLHQCVEMREDLKKSDSFIQTLCSSDGDSCFDQVLAKRCYERLLGGCAAIPRVDCSDKQGKCPEKEPLVEEQASKQCPQKVEEKGGEGDGAGKEEKTEKCDKCYKERQEEIKVEEEANVSEEKQESEVIVKEKKCCG